MTYYFHCTRNTIDVLMANELVGGNKTIYGKKWISMYYSENHHDMFNNKSIYYRRSDVKGSYIGNDYPIPCAFVFAADQFTEFDKSNPQLSNWCFMKLGSEHICRGQSNKISLREDCFKGIYLRKSDGEKNRERLKFVLDILKLEAEVPIAYGDDNFKIDDERGSIHVQGEEKEFEDLSQQYRKPSKNELRQILKESGYFDELPKKSELIEQPQNRRRCCCDPCIIL